MTKEEFLQAKGFIYSDVQREIDLASTQIGSGNFLVALGLLCYTEFAGSLIPGNENKGARVKFNDFLSRMGSDYIDFKRQHNVYSIFRCGLAHEYYVKKNCTIAIFGPSNAIGVNLDKNGNYIFLVENYFKDFKTAFEALEAEIYP